MTRDSDCPCGSKRLFPACCGHFPAGDAQPETAEELMRSRHTAYSLDQEGYLCATWHPTTRRRDLAVHKGQEVKWVGLEILNIRDGARSDAEGHVEFVARYEIDGRAHQLHELSRFLWRANRWFDVDGERQPTST